MDKEKGPRVDPSAPLVTSLQSENATATHNANINAVYARSSAPAFQQASVCLVRGHRISTPCLNRMQGAPPFYAAAHMISGLSESILQTSSPLLQQQAASYYSQHQQSGGQIPLLGSGVMLQMQLDSQPSQNHYHDQRQQQFSSYQHLPPPSQSLQPVLYTLQGVRLDNNSNSMPIQQLQQMSGNLQLPSSFNPRSASESNVALVAPQCANLHYQGNQMQILSERGSDFQQQKQATYGRSDGSLPLLQSQALLGSRQLQFLPPNSYAVLPQGGGPDHNSYSSIPQNQSQLQLQLQQAQQQQLQGRSLDQQGQGQGQAQSEPLLSIQGENYVQGSAVDINRQYELKTQQYLKEAREKLSQLQASQSDQKTAVGRGLELDTNVLLQGQLLHEPGPKLQPHPSKPKKRASETQFLDYYLSSNSLQQQQQQQQEQQQQLGLLSLGVSNAVTSPKAASSYHNLGRSSDGVKLSRQSFNLQGQALGQAVQGGSPHRCSGNGEVEDDEEMKFPPLTLHHLIKPDSSTRLTTQEKNRNAQRRFRERQKERVTQLEGDVSDLRRQLNYMAKANAELNSINLVLDQSLRLHEAAVSVGGGGEHSSMMLLGSSQVGQDGLMSIAAAAAALSDQEVGQQPVTDDALAADQKDLVASMTDLPTLLDHWSNGIKSLIRLLVKTETGGISVPNEAVQASAALTDLSIKLGKSRPDLIRMLASTHMESRDLLIGACESSSPLMTAVGSKELATKSLTPPQQHWRAVLSALAASISDQQELEMVAANERYHSRLGQIMDERSNLLSSCLFDPMQDPSVLFSVTTSHLALPAPFKSTVKFQSAVDNFKANLHQEYLAYAELDGLVTRMILTAEQVAHARCLSYPVPLDALGIVEAVAQTDGKRLVGLSAEAQLLAVSEAVKRQSVSRAGPLSSGGDEDVRMGSEEGLGGEGGEGGEDDCDEEEEGRGRDAHQI